MRVLHAIHDFLPRHRAGSEIYCLQLCQALQARGVATHVLCAEYDPSRPHGLLAWRAVDGVGVTELINDWAFASFAESYDSPLVNRRLEQVLDIVQPDVLHVHNLLNLSFALPAMARARGIPVVATLHDYTLVCPSGGQRIHVAEQHLCRTIDPSRCARCFPQHPLHGQLVFGQRALRRPGGRRVGALGAAIRQRVPWLATPLARFATKAAAPALTAADIEARLAAAKRVFDAVDLFVAPSATIAEEYRRLGLPAQRLRVSDNGTPPLRVTRAPRESGAALRIGFVGTLVWHKGVHVLIDACGLLPAGSFTLALFGDPTVAPDYTARLRRGAEGLPVRFAGGFTHDEAAGIYGQLDVVVVPSLWLENSPLVIHEAFLAGVPVVGSRLGGTAELVNDGVSGLLYEPFSAAALAAALRRLIDDPVLLQRLAAGAPPVKGMDEHAAEWQRTYAELLAGTAVTAAAASEAPSVEAPVGASREDSAPANAHGLAPSPAVRG